MASSVHIEPATVEHARELAPTMRPEDAAEGYASSGLAPIESIEASLAVSEVAFAVHFDGELAVIWGVARVPEVPVAIIWALTGTAVERHRKAFVRESRRAVAWALERYPLLTNWVDSRYTRALRWLSRMGFTVSPPEPFGPEGRPFCHVIASWSQPHG